MYITIHKTTSEEKIWISQLSDIINGIDDNVLVLDQHIGEISCNSFKNINCISVEEFPVASDQQHKEISTEK